MEPEPSLEAEPKVPPEPETRRSAAPPAPELVILRTINDPAQMVGVVMSIKRRQRARLCAAAAARSIAAEAALFASL